MQVTTVVLFVLVTVQVEFPSQVSEQLCSPVQTALQVHWPPQVNPQAFDTMQHESVQLQDADPFVRSVD
jgi:hypothetical protein